MKRRGLIAVLAMMMVMMCVSFSYAEEGALKLTSSYPKDGQTNTSIENVGVKLYFSNSISSAEAKANNQNCVRIVDPDGKAELRILKGEKPLKSVPSALKKDEEFAAVKAFADKLRNQYSRCAAMFERAMEEEEVYTDSELLELCRNPVTAGILNRLVFTGTEKDPALTATLEELRALLVKA